MAVTPLEGMPDVRKKIYAAYWAVGVLLGAIPIGYTAVPDTSVPTWSLVVMALYGYFGIALGFTADKNTSP